MASADQFLLRDGDYQTRLPAAAPLAATEASILSLLAGGPEPRLVSIVEWRNRAGWSLAPRVVADEFLLLPLSGEFEALVEDRLWALRPGQILLLPAGRLHALRNAGRADCSYLVIHALLLDADRRSWWSHWAQPVLRLPGKAGAAAAQDWYQRLALPGRVLAAAPAAAARLLAAVLLDLSASLLESGAPVQPPQRLDGRVTATMRRMQVAYADDASIADYAAGVGLSTVQLRALFRRHLGIGPKAWLDTWRLRQAAGLLRSGDQPVRAVAAAVGFASDHYFHRRFKQRYGVTPSAYRLGQGRL